MRAGKLNTRVYFYERSAERNDYNAVSVSYPDITIATWCQRVITGGSKMLSAEERFFSKSVEILTRYRNDITETMRVKMRGSDNWFEILFIEEVGNRDHLRISLQKINE